MNRLQTIQEDYDLRYKKGIKWRRLTQAYAQTVQFRVVSRHSKIGSFILDIGCGSGRLVSQLAYNQRRVVGVDLSRNGITIAKRIAPGIEFLVASATSLPFRKGIFDMAYLFGTLEYVTNPNHFLVDAVYAVKRNGRVLFNVTSRNRTPQGYVLRPLIRKLIARGRRNSITRAKFSLEEIHEKMSSMQYCCVERISGFYFLLPAELDNFEMLTETDLNSNLLPRVLASMNSLLCKSPLGLKMCGDIIVLLRKHENKSG